MVLGHVTSAGFVPESCDECFADTTLLWLQFILDGRYENAQQSHGNVTLEGKLKRTFFCVCVCLFEGDLHKNSC